jgi:hypothetical protein
MRKTYQEIDETQVPDGVRFDVPRRNQGQMIEVAYGGFGAGPWDDGDLYKRVKDRTAPTTRFYQLKGE